MPKAKKAAKRIDPKVVDERLRKGLSQLKKDQLIEILVTLARQERAVMAALEEQVTLDEPGYDELLLRTRSEIYNATDFDEDEFNRNFSYDSLAYEKVARNFGKLIALDGLSDVMELAILLMKEGSYQAYCSDEGLMCDEIETCLKVVINAVKKSELTKQQRRDWCQELSNADRTGFICTQEIKLLAK